MIFNKRSTTSLLVMPPCNHVDPITCVKKFRKDVTCGNNFEIEVSVGLSPSCDPCATLLMRFSFFMVDLSPTDEAGCELETDDGEGMNFKAKTQKPFPDSVLMLSLTVSLFILSFSHSLGTFTVNKHLSSLTSIP